MRILLLGDAQSERTAYFMQAANALSIAVDFVQLPAVDADGQDASDAWDAFDAWRGFDGWPAPQNCAIKIDPQDPQSMYIDELNAFGSRYTLWLDKLQSVPGARFLNSPDAITQVLDKARCKNALEAAGISTTRSIAGVDSIATLREAMDERRLRGVFIKPRFGSGAAGIIAFRRNLKTNEEIVYTTVGMSEGRLCNTRKQHHVREPQELEAIVNGSLKMGALVEEWIPKASTGGKTYDIRIVWQFGKIEYAVAKLSNGPITNLHLGGHAVNLEELHLGSQTLYEMEKLCGSAMSLFPGLRSAGIDMLLEHNTLKPYIIEINGQGDLLHKDVRGENRIYKNQLLYLNSI